jgi:hypothetical protein
MNNLISLAYVSVASHDMTDEELKKILETARAFNGSNHITGMLLYRDRYFIQVLEGDANAVMPLYEKIKHDPRHLNILMIDKRSIESRTFGQWSMGFNKISDEDIASTPGLNDFLQGKHDINYFTDHADRATLLLELFRDREYF